MHADALPPPRDPGNEWGMPVVLALLVHVLVALVFIIAWVWSPSRSTEAAAGDPVVEATLGAGDATWRVFFRAEDGKWVTGRDCKFGVWTTENLIDVKRLSAETIAELMGGAS